MDLLVWKTVSLQFGVILSQERRCYRGPKKKKQGEWKQVRLSSRPSLKKAVVGPAHLVAGHPAY